MRDMFDCPKGWFRTFLAVVNAYEKPEAHAQRLGISTREVKRLVAAFNIRR